MPDIDKYYKKNKWGELAEKLAADILIRKGYAIRELNWRPMASHLEVDIIASRGDEIVFVEVKARSTEGVNAADAVDDKKIRRLVRAARSYLAAIPYDVSYRFDIIAFTGTPQNYTVEHIEDAFLPPLTSR